MCYFIGPSPEQHLIYVVEKGNHLHFYKADVNLTNHEEFMNTTNYGPLDKLFTIKNENDLNLLYYSFNRSTLVGTYAFSTGKWMEINHGSGNNLIY